MGGGVWFPVAQVVEPWADCMCVACTLPAPLKVWGSVFPVGQLVSLVGQLVSLRLRGAPLTSLNVVGQACHRAAAWQKAYNRSRHVSNQLARAPGQARAAHPFDVPTGPRVGAAPQTGNSVRATCIAFVAQLRFRAPPSRARPRTSAAAMAARKVSIAVDASKNSGERGEGSARRHACKLVQPSPTHCCRALQRTPWRGPARTSSSRRTTWLSCTWWSRRRCPPPPGTGL